LNGIEMDLNREFERLPDIFAEKEEYEKSCICWVVIIGGCCDGAE